MEEVSHEVEQEQQIEPPKVTPSTQRASSPLRPKWDHLHQVRHIPPSYDPSFTQGGRETSVATDYLRPVNWIVSHMLQDGSFRASKYARLHTVLLNP